MVKHTQTIRRQIADILNLIYGKVVMFIVTCILLLVCIFLGRKDEHSTLEMQILILVRNSFIFRGQKALLLQRSHF